MAHARPTVVRSPIRPIKRFRRWFSPRVPWLQRWIKAWHAQWLGCSKITLTMISCITMPMPLQAPAICTAPSGRRTTLCPWPSAGQWRAQRHQYRRHPQRHLQRLEQQHRPGPASVKAPARPGHRTARSPCRRSQAANRGQSPALPGAHR